MSALITTIVIVVILVAIVAWFIHAYNSLVRTRNMVDNGWAQIDVQLKQRADLIPNLVETVKGYATHESQTFEKVTQARAAAANATGIAARADAENQLSRALVNVLATAEQYPELKANQNFIDLQTQLKALEEKIAYARQFYNDVVLKYNNSLQTFPSNIVAGMFHFTQREYFKADEAARTVPQVTFEK
ncbi:MAG: LemA family protein [Bifidobacteriaceae bacterium]|jgi:LemA protein|nr:LemA family protein [Bifidobacteriaceae bacterium]